MNEFLNSLTSPPLLRFSMLVLALMAILFQLPHAYWSVKFSSMLIRDEEFTRTIFGRRVNLGEVQAVAFCFVLSSSVFIFVLLGLHLWALGAALVDAAINILYVKATYFKQYKNQGTERNAANQTRRNRITVAYFLAVIMPAMVYLLAFRYSQL